MEDFCHGIEFPERHMEPKNIPGWKKTAQEFENGTHPLSGKRKRSAEWLESRHKVLPPSLFLPVCVIDEDEMLLLVLKGLNKSKEIK